MLACPHCGFDPYLYLADVKLARQEIEEHWKRKFAEHGIPFPSPKHGPTGARNTDTDTASGREAAEEAPTEASLTDKSAQS